MTCGTMGFRCVRCGKAGRTQRVHSRRHKFKVYRVTARRAAAKMVKMPRLKIQRYWRNKPRIHKPMCFQKLIAEACAPVAARIAGCGPYPTRTALPLNGRVNRDFRKDTFEVFQGKMFYSKV